MLIPRSSSKGSGGGARTATPPHPMLRAISTETTALFGGLPHGDGIGVLAVNRVIPDHELRLVHAQRHEDRDHLENDKRGDDVVDDDERRAFELQQKLVSRVAVEQAGNADAGRLLL